MHESWPVKPDGSTKLSHVGRQVLVQKANAVIQRLEEIWTRALRYTALECVGMVAAKYPLPSASTEEYVDLGTLPEDIPLPHASAAEHIDLWTPPEDPGWLTRESRRPSSESSEELECEEEAEDGRFVIEGSWLELLYQAPDAADAFRFLSLAIAESGPDGELPSATNEAPDCEQNLGCHQLDVIDEEGVDVADALPLQDGIIPSHAGSPEPSPSDSSQSSWLADGTASTSSEASTLDNLLAPWAETFPGVLEAHLDNLDKFDKTSSAPRHLLDWLRVTNLELPHAVANDEKHRIWADCLLRLQDRIYEAYINLSIVEDGLQSAREASESKSSR
ncbi:hypothetical protein OCS_06374 [Ophiocordyceps sinensis CO18]|uniref:Uncharacterized protein n=1 Tax=Ophiocordyceps sinensis (strain Co18 / CGMCC 3.14243) TaxID=911162 RepID=T4ZXP6_OPHSC|nr:hypothetical protein OCS_06374 [Ophiocordyceps sinensis CO18]